MITSYLMQKAMAGFVRVRNKLWQKFPALNWFETKNDWIVAGLIFTFVSGMVYAVTELKFFLTAAIVPFMFVLYGFLVLILIGSLVKIYEGCQWLESFIIHFSFRGLIKALKSQFGIFVAVLIMMVIFINYMQILSDKTNTEIKPRSVLELGSQALGDGKPPQ